MNNETRVKEIIGVRRNVYGDRSEIRRDRLLKQSASIKAESGRVLASAKSRADSIPLGQPILVGHHSEGRDRNFRAKIHSDMGKAYALEDKAAELLNQARAVGSAIASDDPEALTKLQAKLKAAKHAHAVMVAANKAIRAHKGDQAAAIAAIVKTCFIVEFSTGETDREPGVLKTQQARASYATISDATRGLTGVDRTLRQTLPILTA